MNQNYGEASLWTKKFMSVWLSNFFLFVSFHMLIPTFPLYVLKMGGNEVAIGFAVAMFTISSLIVRPFAGKSLDLYGHRKVLIIGLIIFIISALSYFWMAAITLIFIFRFVHGIGWGIVTTAYGTIVSDIVPPERRGEGIGFYGLSNNLSMALGPVFGIWLVNGFGFGYLFLVSMILALCSLLLSQLIQLQPPAFPAAIQNLNISFFTNGLFEISALLPVVLMSIVALSYGGIISFITLFGKELGVLNVGLFFVTIAVMLMIIRPVSGKLYDRKGHPWVIIPGAVFLGIGVLILSYSVSIIYFILASIFYGIGYGMITPALHAWVINLIPLQRRGAANGTFYSAIDLGVGCGSLLLGTVAKLTSYAIMYRSSVLLVVIFLVVYLIHLRKIRINRQRLEHKIVDMPIN